ncbi:MAG: hypothetical protein MZW92_75145 [Comamonadaceae bacterium]|nr:hypothetical protein [Comamonadaceae bacterium]
MVSHLPPGDWLHRPAVLLLRRCCRRWRCCDRHPRTSAQHAAPPATAPAAA